MSGESNQTSQQVNSNQPQDPLMHMFSEILDFRTNSSATTPPLQEKEKAVAGGLYNTYKRATQRFKDGLAELVPDELFAHDRVQTMMDAVDYIVEHQIMIPFIVVEDCRSALQFRKKYSKQMNGGGDEGHEYFILILNYCFRSLKPLVHRATKTVEHVKENAKRFHFTDLELSDSEEETEQDEDAATQRQPERPAEPTQEFTIDDLIKGSDRLQACIFLDSVDSAMKAVSSAYSTLKANMRLINVQGSEEASQLMKDVMEAAVVTNFCIREVQLMEDELQTDHPHFSTFYRVLGSVFLVGSIEELAVCLRACGKSVPKTELTAFIGDVVEGCFRNQETDPCNRIDELVSDFCLKWSVPRDQVATVVDSCMRLVHDEMGLVHVDIKLDKLVDDEDQNVSAELQKLETVTQNWMQDKSYIGGNRNILNTQKHLQGLSNLLILEDKKPGFVGVDWHEEKHLASKIQGDMDHLLMAGILPELLASCWIGPLSLELPRKGELLPIFELLCEYIADPTKPVPLSLTFSMHAILTSIFELQGNNDVTFIAEATMVCTFKFHSSLAKQSNHLTLVIFSLARP